MIPMALSCNPKLLIADEPTTALDVTIQHEIIQLLRELVSQDGLSVLFISHELGLAAQFCDRLAVVFAGEIVEIGPAREDLPEADGDHQRSAGQHASARVGEAGEHGLLDADRQR